MARMKLSFSLTAAITVWWNVLLVASTSRKFLRTKNELRDAPSNVNDKQYHRRDNDIFDRCSSSQMVEGDIKLTPDQFCGTYKGKFQECCNNRKRSRNLAPVGNNYWLWKVRVGDKVEIPYYFNESSFSASKDDVRNALANLEDTGVLKFHERVIPTTEQTNHIVFVSDPSNSFSCWSWIGRAGQTIEPRTEWWQTLTLGSGCMSQGTIQHEVLHALGFNHEHSRPDRDDYVTIHLENVKAGYENNFDKRTTDQVDSLGSPYSYGSVMHYGAYAFSTEKNVLKTIEAPEGIEIGQRDGVDDSDIDQVRLLYQCTTGPRRLTEYHNDPCNTDCKCWEGMTGCNAQDNACQGDLICVDNTCSPPMMGANPTAAPTTVTSKTATPTTMAPTTASPTTGSPTGAPMTAAPTTASKTATPTTMAPSTASPTTAVPSAKAPSTMTPTDPAEFIEPIQCPSFLKEEGSECKKDGECCSGSCEGSTNEDRKCRGNLPANPVWPSCPESCSKKKKSKKKKSKQKKSKPGKPPKSCKKKHLASGNPNGTPFLPCNKETDCCPSLGSYCIIVKKKQGYCGWA